MNIPSTVSFTGLIVIFCFAAVGGIAALVRQARFRVHHIAAALIWVLVICYVAGGAWLNTGYSFADQFLRMEVQHRTGLEKQAQFREISPYRMRHMGGFDYVLWAFGIFSVMLGLVGVIFTFIPGRGRHQLPPLPNDRP